jgi:hypothetical protein
MALKDYAHTTPLPPHCQTLQSPDIRHCLLLQYLAQVCDMHDGIFGKRLLTTEITTDSVVLCVDGGEDVTLKLLPGPFVQQLPNTTAKSYVFSVPAGEQAVVGQWQGLYGSWQTSQYGVYKSPCQSCRRVCQRKHCLPASH